MKSEKGGWGGMHREEKNQDRIITMRFFGCGGTTALKVTEMKQFCICFSFSPQKEKEGTFFLLSNFQNTLILDAMRTEPGKKLVATSLQPLLCSIQCKLKQCRPAVNLKAWLLSQRSPLAAAYT